MTEAQNITLSMLGEILNSEQAPIQLPTDVDWSAVYEKCSSKQLLHLRASGCRKWMGWIIR